VNVLQIRVKLHGRLRTAAGSDEILLQGNVNTAGELLKELMQKLGSDLSRHIFDPGTQEMSPTLVLLVNGHSIKMLEGLKTRLVESDAVTIDSVDIMEIVGGG
jgi:molybdopterin converting factor small subunit